MSNIPQEELAGKCAECERVKRERDHSHGIFARCKEREAGLRVQISVADAAIKAMVEGLPADICIPPPTIKYLSTYVNRA